MEELRFGEIDTTDLRVEVERLDTSLGREEARERFGDPLEGLLDDEAMMQEMEAVLPDTWESLHTQVFLICPEHPRGGCEFRYWKESWWIGRNGEEYWMDDGEEGPPPMIRKDGSNANEAIWHELETEVFAVVRDARGEREDFEPELVRRLDDGRWMSLWHGVCEVWPAKRIEEYELIPAAEW